MMMRRSWDAVAVTAPTQELADAVCSVLRGSLNDAILIAVPDAAPTLQQVEWAAPGRVGAGAALLNTILTLSEELSARGGFSTMNDAVLRDARVLVLQVGTAPRGGSAHPCLSQALTVLPIASDAGPDVLTSAEWTLRSVTRLFASAPPGLVVASTDSLVLLPTALDWLELDARGTGAVIAVPMPLEEAIEHGVCTQAMTPSSATPRLASVVYRGSRERLSSLADASGSVPVYTGMIWFNAPTAFKLLELHARPPLDACTYIGIDSGAPSLALALHNELLVPLCAGATLETLLAQPATEPGRSAAARKILWASLRPPDDSSALALHVAPTGKYVYMRSTSALQRHLVSPSPLLFDGEAPTSAAAAEVAWTGARLTACHAHPSVVASVPEGSVAAATNCMFEGFVTLGSSSAVEHCQLPSGTVVGKGAFLSGIHSCSAVCWPEGVQAFEVLLRNEDAPELPHAVAATKKFGRTGRKGGGRSGGGGSGGGDGEYGGGARALMLVLPLNLHDEEAAKRFVEQRGGCIGASDLWPMGGPLTLWRARLYPVYKASSQPWLWTGVSWMLDCTGGAGAGRPPAEWSSAPRVSLEEGVSSVDVVATLAYRAHLSVSIALRSLCDKLVQPEPAYVRPELQRLACGSRERLEELLDKLDCLASESTPQLAARAFAAMADALALRAGTRGGLRSGPAANQQWRAPLHLLRRGEVAAAVESLAVIRAQWIASDEPRMLVRTARHYEGAVGECISFCVRTCVVDVTPTRPTPVGEWVICESPARIDLAGGWSDTPPICYEFREGGTVVNAAIEIDGTCPIGAKARRIAEPILRITIDPTEGPIECTELEHLADHNSPLAPGALPKTVVLFCGLAKLGSNESLEEQLRRGGGGLEITSWSNLPTGSGLGTSSILAAALIGCVGLVAGQHYTPEALVHAVSQVEQMLTTGGGWQDQVGGVFPGIKVCQSLPSLPLVVKTEAIPLPEATIALLNRHLQLIYTGKTRLARNLLQDVLRRWYSANPAIMANVAGLVNNAVALREALRTADIPAVGKCLGTYWAQKKKMCDAEPASITKMMSKLQPLVHGAALAGAGGGGFLIMVTKEPDAAEAVAHALRDEEVTLHKVAIHLQGLTTRREVDVE